MKKSKDCFAGRVSRIIFLFFVSAFIFYRSPQQFLHAKETLIEVSVEVAEINNSAARELGIKWTDTLRIGEIVKGSVTGFFFDRLTGNFLPLPSDQNPAQLPTSQPSPVPWDFPTLFKAGETARYNPFIADLKLLADKGAVKITSKPRILTKSGAKAKFQSGGSFPVVTESATRINVAYKEFGILLSITPTELPDDYIDLKIETEVSRLDFTQLVAGRYPIISKREASTNLVLKSEDTLALGGMVETKKETGRVGIPYLMDIPLLGYLFGIKRTIDVEQTVVIFVTPKIFKE